MERLYEPPNRIEGETNEEWCDRYAAMIPPELLLSQIIETMHGVRKRRGPAWSQIGYFTGHGSGVSSAIVKRYFPDPVQDQVDELRRAGK